MLRRVRKWDRWQTDGNVHLGRIACVARSDSAWKLLGRVLRSLKCTKFALARTPLTTDSPRPTSLVDWRGDSPFPFLTSFSVPWAPASWITCKAYWMLRDILERRMLLMLGKRQLKQRKTTDTKLQMVEQKRSVVAIFHKMLKTTVAETYGLLWLPNWTFNCIRPRLRSIDATNKQYGLRGWLNEVSNRNY